MSAEAYTIYLPLCPIRCLLLQCFETANLLPLRRIHVSTKGHGTPMGTV